MPDIRRLRDELILSLRSGYLFGNHEEPLDAYGKRIVRVIQEHIDDALFDASVNGALHGDDE